MSSMMKGLASIRTSRGVGILLLFLHIESLLHILVDAQIEVSEPPICSCTPLEYSWVLKFDDICPEDGMDDIGGIHDHTCSIGSKYKNHAVEVVTDYTVLEFGTNLDDIAHSKKETNLTLYEDDKIFYESVTKSSPDVFSKGMIMIVEGLNADQQKVQLYWAIHFTNDCNTIPALGNFSLGWTRFDHLVPARCQSCDAIAEQSINQGSKKKKCKKKVKIPKKHKSGKSKGKGKSPKVNDKTSHSKGSSASKGKGNDKSGSMKAHGSKGKGYHYSNTFKSKGKYSKSKRVKASKGSAYQS